MPARKLDDIVTAYAPQHDALLSELDAIATAADMNVIAEARAKQLQVDLMWANHRVVKAKAAQREADEKYHKAKGKTIGKILMRKKSLLKEDEAGR